MSMETKTTLPFADTIFCDIRKIVDAAFSDCAQKDLDRLCLMGYDVNNDAFMCEDIPEGTLDCTLHFSVEGKGLPVGKFYLDVYCSFFNSCPDGKEVNEIVYKATIIWDNLGNYVNIENRFEDLHSALAYCDGYEAGDITDCYVEE